MQVFVNSDSESNVAAIVRQLSKAVAANEDCELKAFVVFIDAKEEELEKLAEQKKADNIGLVLLKGPDDPALKKYKINTDRAVKNTVFVYAKKTVTAKFVNYDARKDRRKLQKAIAEACK